MKAARLLNAHGHSSFAASRAYYAMFYLAQAFLLDKGLAFSSHKATIAAFGREVARKGEVPLEFHRFLIDAQSRRLTGDYDLEPDLSVQDVLLDIERAGQLLRLAKAKLR